LDAEIRQQLLLKIETLEFVSYLSGG